MASSWRARKLKERKEKKKKKWGPRNGGKVGHAAHHASKLWKCLMLDWRGLPSQEKN